MYVVLLLFLQVLILFVFFIDTLTVLEKKFEPHLNQTILKLLHIIKSNYFDACFEPALSTLVDLCSTLPELVEAQQGNTSIEIIVNVMLAFFNSQLFLEKKLVVLKSLGSLILLFAKRTRALVPQVIQILKELPVCVGESDDADVEDFFSTWISTFSTLLLSYKNDKSIVTPFYEDATNALRFVMKHSESEQVLKDSLLLIGDLVVIFGAKLIQEKFVLQIVAKGAASENKQVAEVAEVTQQVSGFF